MSTTRPLRLTRNTLMAKAKFRVCKVADRWRNWGSGGGPRLQATPGRPTDSGESPSRNARIRSRARCSAHQ